MSEEGWKIRRQEEHLGYENESLGFYWVVFTPDDEDLDSFTYLREAKDFAEQQDLTEAERKEALDLLDKLGNPPES